jgi:hypothetical protein
MDLHPDFADLLAVLARFGVEYIVVGGYAYGFHAPPRYTKDIDIWYRGTDENRAKLARALADFGAPASLVSTAQSAGPDEVLFLGEEPARVDFLQHIEGVVFDECYPRASVAEWHDTKLRVLSIDDLIANKRAVGRLRDLADVEKLERVRARREKGKD